MREGYLISSVVYAESEVGYYYTAKREKDKYADQCYCFHLLGGEV